MRTRSEIYRDKLMELCWSMVQATIFSTLAILLWAAVDSPRDSSFASKCGTGSARDRRLADERGKRGFHVGPVLGDDGLGRDDELPAALDPRRHPVTLVAVVLLALVVGAEIPLLMASGGTGVRTSRRWKALRQRP